MNTAYVTTSVTGLWLYMVGMQCVLIKSWPSILRLWKLILWNKWSICC